MSPRKAYAPRPTQSSCPIPFNWLTSFLSFSILALLFFHSVWTGVCSATLRHSTSSLLLTPGGWLPREMPELHCNRRQEGQRDKEWRGERWEARSSYYGRGHTPLARRQWDCIAKIASS